MPEHTIVAVYDTAAHAQAAVRSLEAANISSSAISQHASTTTSSTAAAPVQEKGFWSSLFGGDNDDADIYSRSVGGGSTVVTVVVPEEHVSRVSPILEQHHPIDLDERAATYGMAQSAMTATATTTTAAAAPVLAAKPALSATPAKDDVIRVVEERLVVGKRAISNGGVRVRAYVVETPVEAQVTLRDETIHVERHPVTDGRSVSPDAFRDRTVEMTETDEVAVVSKQARVVEEINLRKEATDRVETVRDTVRRTEVEIEDSTDVNRTGRTTSVAGSLGTSGANPSGGAPDGTPGNPKGTMASRAVDNTLGINVSGANPTRK